MPSAARRRARASPASRGSLTVSAIWLIRACPNWFICWRSRRVWLSTTTMPSRDMPTVMTRVMIRASL
ncbi:MAG: hypothetical protein CVV05_11035 [Gammaproteobacteria bacterium HGW-Gammaproteobacteria-1]|nr:MAG: hypothetical protein CVV05_11035 [Gammaproteobacteria bacterium HGW-Gammaproteobacteria-1]